MSISGEYAIVGVYAEDAIGSNSGAAYIFKRDGNIWTQTAKLTASDGTTSDYFGYAVSISGDYAVVDSTLDDDKGTDSGSVYIFQRNGSSWNQIQKITAKYGTDYNKFVRYVCISGDYIIVGEPYDDSNGPDTGAAHIFEKNDASWAFVNKISTNDKAAVDYFGFNVSISDDYAIIGACNDDENGSNSGSSYF